MRQLATPPGKADVGHDLCLPVDLLNGRPGWLILIMCRDVGNGSYYLRRKNSTEKQQNEGDIMAAMCPVGLSYLKNNSYMLEHRPK